MTFVYKLPVAPVSGAAKSLTATERALLNSPDIVAWWRAGDANYSLTGGTWADRKRGYQATLVDATKRPTQTTIGDMPVMKTGASDPTAIWVTDDDVLPENEWTIFTIVDNHGTSALSSIWSVVGDDGNTLGMRWRSSGLGSLNLDASGTEIGTLTGTDGAPTDPHLVEVGYGGTNEAYAYKDGTSFFSTATVTGWTRESGRISIGGAWDITDGVLAYGRTIGIAEIVIARISAIGVGTAARALMKAYTNEFYAGQITVA
jgi:hypothetical protein